MFGGRTVARALFAFLVAFLVGAPALAAPAPWQVSEVAGNVQIVENGRGRAARRGALLAPGSTIATDARGRAVLVRGKEFVMVSSGTRIRVPEARESRGGIIQMITDFGSALFRIERRETPHFGVQTPYLAAVVKGTTFKVTVGNADAAVQVSEGAVEVATANGGVSRLIEPGMVASVAASDPHQLSVKAGGRRVVHSAENPAGKEKGASSRQDGARRGTGPKPAAARNPASRAGAAKLARSAQHTRGGASGARDTAKAARDSAKVARDTARAAREEVRAVRETVRAARPRKGR